MTETLQELCDSPRRADARGPPGGDDPGSENPRTGVAQRPQLSARGPGRRRRPLYEGAKVNVNHPKSEPAAGRATTRTASA